MSRSLRVSSNYIEYIKASIHRAGFASQTQLAREMGISRATVSKFFNGKQIDVLNFTELCDGLGLDWKEVSSPSTPKVEKATYDGRQQLRDWGDAPDYLIYGHSGEKQKLESYISDLNCRLVTVTGMARIGKTFLVAEVARSQAHQFDFVIWKRGQDYKGPKQLTADLIEFVENRQIDKDADIQDCISQLISCFRKHRCLVVLNRMELLMQSGGGLGNFLEGDEAYGALLRRIGEQNHQSCLIAISREPFKDLTTYVGENRALRQIPVGGLDLEEARAILKQQNLHGSFEKQDELIKRYGGHPTFVRIAASYVKQLCHGDIERFLGAEQAPIVINGIKTQLDKIFERISELEKDVLSWIAIYQIPCSEGDLSEFIQTSPANLRNALLALRRRSLVEIADTGNYQIHDYIREYVLSQIGERIIQELKAGELIVFNQYPLMLGQANDRIRQKQQVGLLQPVFIGIKVHYGRNLANYLSDLIDVLRRHFHHRSGYAATNLISLLKLDSASGLHGEEKPVLKQYDFSDLVIRQADLRGIRLQDVNFSYTDLGQSIFYEPFGGILSIALSRDGHYLAAGDASHNVYVWKIEGSSFKLHRKYTGHTHWVRTVAFSPTGRYLVSGSEDNTVRAWEVESGETVAVLRGYDRRIRSLAFSPSEDYLATAGDDSTVVLLNTRTRQRIGTYTGSFEERRFRAVIFDATGQFLIAANQNGQIHFWDIGRDIELQNPQILNCQDSLVRTIALHPDGHLLASGGDDGVVKLWQFPSGEFLGELPGQSNWIRKIIFSYDGNLIAASSEDGKIQVWSIVSRKTVNLFEAHEGRVWEIAFCPNGKAILSGSDDQQIKLWSLSEDQCLATLQGYTCKQRSVVFSPDGKWLASGGDDSIIRIWDLESGNCINQFSGHAGRVWTIAFHQSRQGKLYLISGSDDRAVKYWDVATGQCISTSKDHTSWVRAVSISSTQQLILSGGDDKVIRAFHPETCESREFHASHNDWIVSLAVTTDGKLAISGSDDGTAKIWNVKTGELIHTFEHHRSPIRAIAVSPDDQWVAMGSNDKTIRLFNLIDSQHPEYIHSPLQGQEGHEGWIRCITFHPTAPILASGGYDQKTILWDIETGKPLKVLRGHDEAVISVAFDPKGKLIATGSEDETIKLWDVETGKPIKTIRIPRPYEGLDITGATGLSREQRIKLFALGAVAH